MSNHPDNELTPAQIAVLKRQLEAANERLLAVERKRQELQEYIATLTTQLKRAENSPVHPMPRRNRMTQREDLKGRRFGKWIVQGYRDKSAWWCQCQGCGDTKPVSKRNLLKGKSTQCRACYQRLMRRHDPNIIRRLQVEGMTNKQIAEHLGCGPQMVYRHGLDPFEIERLRRRRKLSTS